MVRHKHVMEELEEYRSNKEVFEQYRDKASPKQIADYEKIIQDEKQTLASVNKYLIRKKAKQIEQLTEHIYLKQDDRFIDYFYYFRFMEEDKFTNVSKLKSFIEIGTQAIEKNNLHELKAVCNQIYGLLKEKPKNSGLDDNFEGSIGLK
jgi:molecular chaperone DnaK